nr:hypothetical protein [Tanacetum cinerariifolium]
MYFLLSSMSVVYVLTTPMPEDGGKNLTVEQVRRRAKWDNDDYVCRGLTLNAKYMAEDASRKKFLVSNFINYKMTDLRLVLEQYNELLGILERLQAHLKHLNKELTLIELGSYLCIKKSLRVQDSDKLKGNNVVGPSVVNMVEHNNSSRDFKGSNVGNKANGSGTEGSGDGFSNPLKGPNMFSKSLQIYYVTYVSEVYFVRDDDVSWWVDSGETVHVCKDRCWFKTYESLNDGSILHMRNESTALVHGCGCVDLRFGRLNIVCDNIGSAFMSTSKLNDSILWHARLGHVHFKRMQDMSKDGLISAFDMDTEKCKTYMLTKITKKLFQNVKRETKVLELIHSDLCDLHATPSLGNKKYFVTFIEDASRVPDKRNRITPYELWTKKTKPELPQSLRFYVIEPNDSVAINLIIELRDVIFDEHRFSSVPRPSQRSLKYGTEDSGGSMVFERVTEEVVQQPESELRKRKKRRTPKDFGSELQLYLIEGTKDEISDQHFYFFNVEDDPKTMDEAMKSQDVAFWTEEINDEMDSIMGNNTWVLD